MYISRSGAGMMRNLWRLAMQPDGDKMASTIKVTKPMPRDIGQDVQGDGNSLTGTVTLGVFGNAALIGSRI